MNLFLIPNRDDYYEELRRFSQNLWVVYENLREVPLSFQIPYTVWNKVLIKYLLCHINLWSSKEVGVPV